MFAQDLVHIRDSKIGNIIAIGIVDHSSHLYFFSHFGSPFPLSESHSPSSLENTEVKSSCFNLCVVLETSVVASMSPPPV